MNFSSTRQGIFEHCSINLCTFVRPEADAILCRLIFRILQNIHIYSSEADMDSDVQSLYNRNIRELPGQKRR